MSTPDNIIRILYQIINNKMFVLPYINKFIVLHRTTKKSTGTRVGVSYRFWVIESEFVNRFVLSRPVF